MNPPRSESMSDRDEKPIPEAEGLSQSRMAGINRQLMTMQNTTPTRFKAVCRRVGVPDERAKSAFSELIRLYADENRAYHNLTHIDRMLSWFDTAGDHSDSVELAIWFHDAIYDPLGSDNEAKSAQYFADHLGQFICGELADDVRRLIMATDPRRPRSGRDDEDLIVDIDLSILGGSEEDYEAYQAAIRWEYSFVPDAEFVAGRSGVLRRFLSQRIYATGFFATLENQARSNIQNELDALESLHRKEKAV